MNSGRSQQPVQRRLDPGRCGVEACLKVPQDSACHSAASPATRGVRVLCVAGARPNFVKIAPLLRAFQARPLFDARLIHTGQHYDPALSDVFFDELRLPRPAAHLGVNSGSHTCQIAEFMRRFDAVLDEQQPEVVVVVGDVNSTLACALAAAKFELTAPFELCAQTRHKPLLIHVEAGLRSFDAEMPEEANRRVTDMLSDLLYVSEPSGLTNLKNEGVPDERVALVGNVMIDSLIAAKECVSNSTVLADLGMDGRYGVVTLHRPSNVDDPVALEELLHTLDRLSYELPLVFPVHPRTRKRMRTIETELENPRWRLVEPLGYFGFLRLLGSAQVVLTDSGGIQEETTALGVPCLTLRNNTERPITVAVGTNQLVGTQRSAIEAAFRRAVAGEIRGQVPELWDGRAAERIADHLQAMFVQRSSRGDACAS
jgi:UDP-N-acetylglucosamine 2-epimerase (non-hydrolysing)